MQTSMVEGPIEAPTNPDFPAACNWLRADSFYGSFQSLRWSLGVRTVTAAKHATKTTEAVAESIDYRELASGNSGLTPEQWADWTDQGTDPYVLQCTADNIGVTLAPMTAAKAGAKKKAAT